MNTTLTTEVIGQLVTTLLAAPLLALLVSVALLRLYRRAVLKSMRNRTSPRAPVPSETPGRTARTEPTMLEHAPATATGAEAEALYREALRAPWRAAAVYAVAGFCYALVMTATYLVATSTNPLLLQFLVLFWAYAWPVVLTVNLVAAATWRAKLAIAAAYFLPLVVVAAVAAGDPASLLGQAAAFWALTNLPATALLLAFLNRRVRAVGPLVLVLMILAVTGSNLVFPVAGSDRGLRSIADLGQLLGLGVSDAFIMLIVLGFVVFGLAGWPVLRWIGRRYEGKKISDQSITLDAVWLLFGIVQSLLILVPEGIAWIFSGLLAFAVYKAVAWAAFLLLGREVGSARKSPRLLLLRVFSLGRRSERLFDALGTHWRHVGSIRLIAGPDLATTTVEPHEFLDFLGGKLARRFIDGPQTLDLRISEMDLEPDRDGRFRVSDFFCYEDTWQMVLSRLVDESDAVLMDLRGFSPQNEGVTFEINELINVVPLGRVVFVIDETTDEEFLRQTVQESWEKMRPTSPNRSSTPAQLRLFRYTGSRGGELRQLLHTLCGAAGVATSAAARV